MVRTRPAWCWPDPATMLINLAACRTRIHSASSNSVSSNREAALPAAGVPKWRPVWSRRGAADVRMVAEVVAETMAGGRAGWKKEKKICSRRGTDGRGGCSTTGEDLSLQGGCAAVFWWRRKASVGSSGAEETVEKRWLEKKTEE
jgi:hypothetical protein